MQCIGRRTRDKGRFAEQKLVLKNCLQLLLDLFVILFLNKKNVEK